MVCGDRGTGALLTEHRIPALLSITGSTRAGKAVARAAAENVKRTHLELGGNAPVVVFADADLADAAEGISMAGYFNAGQDCTAATRVLVEQSAHGDFVGALAERAKAVRLSRDEKPDDDALFIPPVNNKNQLAHVSGLVDRAPAHASVVTGGEALGPAGYFYAPTVIDNLRQGDELVGTEIFGPVITVQTFADEDEAIRLANDTDYGLSSSVWTSNHARALRTSAAIDARLCMGELPHPADRRDAARRFQAVRPRQGSVPVLPGGLHPHQARHVVPGQVDGRASPRSLAAECPAAVSPTSSVSSPVTGA